MYRKITNPLEPSTSAGFEPANIGSRCESVTPRPPRPTQQVPKKQNTKVTQYADDRLSTNEDMNTNTRKIKSLKNKLYTWFLKCRVKLNTDRNYTHHIHPNTPQELIHTPSKKIRYKTTQNQ